MNFTKKKLTLVILLVYHACACAQKIPQAKISNGIITAQIYLPDAEKGYYRGGRFDWAGVIPHLEFKGHTYYGKWFTEYDPFLHDAIMGPVEAYNPLGYSKEKSKKKEPFTKVGVGILEPLDTLPYLFSKPYKILDHGKWETKADKDKIVFTHTLSNGEYPYVYTKTIRLSGDNMIIDHTLTNKGSQLIDTHVFNHNFFIIDDDSIGPGYVLKLGFNLNVNPSTLEPFAKLEGNDVVFVRPLVTPSDHPSLRVKGFSTTDASEYDLRIENRNTEAGVHITADKPISSMYFWTAPKSICPEPFIHVLVEPGKSFSWSIIYKHYTISKDDSK